MSYTAVDVLEEAFHATKALLLPFRLRRWLVLAVVVFFVSGATGFDPTVNLGAVDLPVDPFRPEPGPGPGPGPGAEPMPFPEPTVVSPFDLGLEAVLFVAAAALVLFVVFGFVGAVMEFVFVRIAEHRDVRIRGYVVPNLRKGLSLLVLRVLLGLVVLATALLVVAAALVGRVAVLLVLLVLSPVFVAGLVGAYLVHRFTVDFVVPVALVADVGVFGAWRRFASELRAEPAQYGVYALVRVALGVVAAMVAGAGFALVGFVVALPFLLVLGGVFALDAVFGLGAAFLPLAAAVGALMALAALVAGVTLVQVPVSTYLRYYALLVLADVSPGYDLVSAVRRDLDGGPTGGDAGGGSGDGGGNGDGGVGPGTGGDETVPDADSDLGPGFGPDRRRSG